MNFNFVRASSLLLISLFVLMNSGFAAKQPNTTAKASPSENYSGADKANMSGGHVVKTQGLPEGGIKSVNPASTATTANKSTKAPELSDFNIKLNLSSTSNAVKITNVDLFSVVSDTDVGDIYSINSIKNLRGCSTSIKECSATAKEKKDLCNDKGCPVNTNVGCATILDGEIIYIASKDFRGDAKIDFTVVDGEGNVSDTEQVTVHVVKE